MIDEKLSKLKNDIPNIDVNDYKNNIYQKYENTKTKKIKYNNFKLKHILTLILIILSLSLTAIIVLNRGGTKGKKYDLKELNANSRLLTKVVYNASVQDNEEYQLTEIQKNNKFTNNIYFSSFKLHNSFGFYTSFDFTMEPYISDYVIGDEVFIVIALLEFYSEEWVNGSLYQKMIIISYKEQITGFMSPISNSSKEGIFSETNLSKNEDLQTLYSFESAHFLTNGAIVKYYEKNDIIYHFEYKEYKDGKYELLVNRQGKEYINNINKDIIKELSNDVVIELLKLTYIEKIEVIVTIIGIDEKEKRKLYIKSDDISSIETLYYRYLVFDINNNLLNQNDLKVGDKIKIYYYNRYPNYQPQNITVDNIIVVE